MARPKAKELTERELELMHVFWKQGTCTAQEVRDSMEKQGRDLAYTTVATLIKILCDKGFLVQTNDDRPFRYQPLKTFDEVSSTLIGDLVEKVFDGHRDQLLVRLLGQKKLTSKERAFLKQLLEERE